MWTVKAPKQPAKHYEYDAFATPVEAARAYALETFAGAIRQHCLGNVSAPGPYSVVVAVSGPDCHVFVRVAPLVAFDAAVVEEAEQ